MFEEFLGNESLKKDMKGLLETATLPHAIAVCGRRGCGGGYFARLLAAAYLEDRNGLVLRGEHPDYLEITGEGVSGDIKIETVRENLYEISLASVMTDSRRVFCIKHAEHLNESSANALLKAIEEPLPGTVFILTVSDPAQLKETIRSRTALYYVLPLEMHLCASEITKRVPSCSAETALKMADIFAGRLGLALSVLKDRNAEETFRCACGFCEAAVKRERYPAMMWAASRIGERASYRDFLEMSSLYCGYMIRKEPESIDRLSVIASAIDEAYASANSVNLKLSAQRLAIRSIQDKR